jgi:hypothetical protein
MLVISHFQFYQNLGWEKLPTVDLRDNHINSETFPLPNSVYCTSNSEIDNFS